MSWSEIKLAITIGGSAIAGIVGIVGFVWKLKDIFVLKQDYQKDCIVREKAYKAMEEKMDSDMDKHECTANNLGISVNTLTNRLDRHEEIIKEIQETSKETQKFVIDISNKTAAQENMLKLIWEFIKGQGTVND